MRRRLSAGKEIFTDRRGDRQGKEKVMGRRLACYRQERRHALERKETFTGRS